MFKICWECKKELDVEDLKNQKAFYEGQRVYCSDCYKKRQGEKEKENSAYIALKKKRMFEKAVSIMEKQIDDIYDYRGAILKVQNYLYSNLDAFDSSYEIVAAIVLIQKGYKIRTQYKIGKYQVDFIVPDLKVVLEIDGIHHKLRSKDGEHWRDIEIENALGNDWKVIRISTERVERGCEMLVDYITALQAIKGKTDIY